MSLDREQHASGAELTITSLLEAAARDTPDALALLGVNSAAWTYEALARQTERIAGQLRSLGIGRHDRVALVHRNGPELASAFLGVASAAVCAPLNPSYRPAEFDFYLSDLEVKAILVGKGEDSPVRDLANLRDLPLIEIEADDGRVIRLSRGRARPSRPPAGEDTALVLHTSGTTARPKIVPLTHSGLVRSARNIARTLELTRGDRCLNVMPLFHIHALVGTLLSSLSAGASVVCTTGFHAPSFHRWLAELEPTWYSAVPTMHQAVLERVSDRDAARRTALRFVRSSSAPLPTRVYESLGEAFGVPVVEAYGMTEAAHQMTSNPLPPAERKPGSVGLATHIEVAIRGADGQMLGVGEPGEVVIRGETVFPGYEANPEANDAAFVDGWFRTGDEGSFDADGYLFLRGRTKEIINRAGEKVSPGEVEDVLLRHPDVEQAVIFAVPHQRLGEDVGAAVVLRAGAAVTGHDLQRHAAAGLSHFKVPSVVVVVDEVPVGATGKLQRIGLAERLGIGEVELAPSGAPYVEPASLPEKEMAELWAETLDVDRVGLADDFFALGGDSILGAELIATIAERHGRELPLTTLMWAPTLGAFTALVADETWTEDALIVPVQTDGKRPPLFIAHGLGSEVLNVAVLKRTLGPDQPLYAIRAPLERFDYDSVEDMASDYFDEIQTVQPKGPYLFASLCSGGAVVIELARRARASGERVELAAVIDPVSRWGRHGVRHYAWRTADYVRNRRLMWAVGRKLRHWRSHLMPKRYPDSELQVDSVAPVMKAIRRRYKLRRIPGTLTVLSTMDYGVPKEFWERYADRVDWYSIETPHHTIFQHPHADVLGETLSDVLADLAPEEA